MRNSTRTLAKLLAIAATVFALGAPVASARHADEYFHYNSALARPAPASAPSPSVPASVSGDGFDWGDAGIGATAILALAAIAAGSVVTLRHRPSRDSLA